jgi:hypothetical protein
MYTRWLFVPFSTGFDDEVFKMAQDWKSVDDWQGKRTVIVRYANNERGDAGCLSGVVDDDKIYVLAHGNIGCTTIANQFTDATEELNVNELCTRIQTSKLSTEINVTINLYACGAGGRAEVIAGCGSGAVFADYFAKTLNDQFYYFSAKVYGYTESVTSPERNNDSGLMGHKLAVGNNGKILGDASKFKKEFKPY